jgi:hypothetical protein
MKLIAFCYVSLVKYISVLCGEMQRFFMLNRWYIVLDVSYLHVAVHMNSCWGGNLCDFFIYNRTPKNQSLVVAFRKAMLEKSKKVWEYWVVIW